MQMHRSRLQLHGGFSSLLRSQSILLSFEEEGVYETTLYRTLLLIFLSDSWRSLANCLDEVSPALPITSYVFPCPRRHARRAQHQARSISRYERDAIA